MRRLSLLMFLAFFAALVSVRADETEDKAKALIAEQKKRAEMSWGLLEAGDFATLETDHFLLYATKPLEAKLNDAGKLAENQFKTAREGLKFPDKTEPWKGKLTVYLFNDRPQFTAFIRRVEKRRVESGEIASHSSADDTLHVACSKGQNKWDWPVEAQAVEQVASVLLERKAGLAVVLPDWLVSGFGRATYYRILPKDPLTEADRRLAADLVAKKRKSARDVWMGPLDPDEAATLHGVLADFFVYGPGAVRVEKLLEGFKPGEDMEKKTTEQAIEQAGMKQELIELTWRSWIVSPM